MFGISTFWIKLGAIALAVTVCFGSGWWVRDSFCDAAALRVQLSLKQSEIDDLNRTITARDNADKTLKAQSEIDRAYLEKLQNEIDQFKTTDGVCLPKSDVDGLRKLWRKGS